MSCPQPRTGVKAVCGEVSTVLWGLDHSRRAQGSLQVSHQGDAEQKGKAPLCSSPHPHPHPRPQESGPSRIVRLLINALHQGACPASIWRVNNLGDGACLCGMAASRPASSASPLPLAWPASRVPRDSQEGGSRPGAPRLPPAQLSFVRQGHHSPEGHRAQLVPGQVTSTSKA